MVRTINSKFKINDTFCRIGELTMTYEVKIIQKKPGMKIEIFKAESNTLADLGKKLFGTFKFSDKHIF